MILTENYTELNSEEDRLRRIAYLQQTLSALGESEERYGLSIPLIASGGFCLRPQRSDSRLQPTPGGALGSRATVRRRAALRFCETLSSEWHFLARAQVNAFHCS